MISCGGGGGCFWRGGTHLDDDEAGTGRVSAGKVDAALVVGDIEALDGSLGSADEAGEGREDEGLHDDAVLVLPRRCRVEDWRSQDRRSRKRDRQRPFYIWISCPTVSLSQGGTDLNGRCRWFLSLESLSLSMVFPTFGQEWLNGKVRKMEIFRVYSSWLQKTKVVSFLKRKEKMSASRCLFCLQSADDLFLSSIITVLQLPKVERVASSGAREDLGWCVQRWALRDTDGCERFRVYVIPTCCSTKVARRSAAHR